MTAFIHTRIDVGHGLTLVVDGNSKITGSNGTYEKPTPNAFSLPAASVDGELHCPGSTETCRASCYVRGLAKHAPDVYAAYHENARALDVILASPVPTGRSRRDPFFDTARRLGAWIAEHASGGFRWHVSGDVRGAVHAMWIGNVCASSPNVRHWIYTRTFSAVPILSLATNLTVNVSGDRDNYMQARAAARTSDARICYMSSGVHDVPADLPDGSVLFPDYPVRGRELERPTSHPWWQSLDHRLRLMVCPPDFFGQSESARCGPCQKCIAPTGVRRSLDVIR